MNISNRSLLAYILSIIVIVSFSENNYAADIFKGSTNKLIKLSDIDYKNAKSYREWVDTCNGLYITKSDLDFEDLCIRTFSCGTDGECSPNTIIVIVRSDKIENFMNLIDSLNILEMHTCKRDDDYENCFNTFENPDKSGSYACGVKGHPYTAAFGRRFRKIKDFVCYFGSAQSGYEAETVLSLRKRKDVVYIAVRPGGEAGSPAEYIGINEAAFQIARHNNMMDLRNIVIKSIENLYGRKCANDNKMTCSVFPSDGRLKVSILAVGTVKTAYKDLWERSYLEIYPSWNGRKDDYKLHFEMPVTQIKKWPIHGDKPTGKFESVDYDDRFVNFRSSLISNVINQLSSNENENEN